MNQLLLMFLAAFAVSVVCTPLAIKLAPKIGAVDVPKDARRVHTKPMPRFGGMAIFLGTMSVITVFLEKDSQLAKLILDVYTMIIGGSTIGQLRRAADKIKAANRVNVI